MTQLDTSFLVDLPRESRREAPGAATARIDEVRLVTRDVRSFERVPGLVVLSY